MKLSVRKNILFVLLVFGICLPGCTEATLPPQASPSPEVDLRSPTVQINLTTSTVRPWITQTIGTRSTLPVLTSTTVPTHTPMPIIDPLTHLRTQCLNPISSLPENMRPDGFLVLDYSPLFGHSSQLYLYELASETSTKIADEYYALSVAPDQKHIYYMDCSGSSCNDTISTVEGPVVTVPYDPERVPMRWLDDEHLDFNHTVEPYNSVFIFNPFTGVEETLSLNVPNPFYAPLLDFPRLENAIDPSLTRVVYFDTEGIGRVIMWDIQTSRMLAWLPYPVPYAPMPGVSSDYLDGWSPDSSQFVINSPVGEVKAVDGNPAAEELFSISRDGETKRLTYLSEKFGLFRIYSYHWSPDGRSIAFWARMAENADKSIDDLENHFIVLDTVTLEATDYCISSQSNFTPVWSPNSEQIVIPLTGGKFYLLDITHNNLVRIIVDMLPEGWVIAP
jgi:hypothetical protein